MLSSDGLVLTNAHVVEGADEIIVKLSDKREFRARLMGADPRSDVALLKIEASGLPKVKIGAPATLKVGEWVAAIGAPFGFDNTVTAGPRQGRRNSSEGTQMNTTTKTAGRWLFHRADVENLRGEFA